MRKEKSKRERERKYVHVFDANHPYHYLALVNTLKLSYAWIESHHNSSETNSSA